MKSKIIITLLTLLILGYVCLKALIYYLGGMDYQNVSSKSAPDSRYLITEFHSMTEVSHAPYGLHLVLSSKPVNTPENGHVIFAGYCKSLAYSWITNREIMVTCVGSEEDPVRSRSLMAYGISINYE